ncbi:MAG: DAK2 domain-containing protein [Sediminispirochaetaceae bacterium]
MAEGTLSPAELKKCLITAEQYLETNYDILNNLNVFPVPDGDTGTNMLSTFEAGVRAIRSREGDGDTLSSIAGRMNAELIRNSRGNSGFILARFFHGFFESAEGLDALAPENLAAGFAAGLYQVHISLFSPVEGTMITVIRAMTEALKSAASAIPAPALPEILEHALEAGRRALADTPRLLPILARAGVIDSGALGFVFLIEGFRRGLTGEAAVREREDDYRFTPNARAAGPNTGKDDGADSDAGSGAEASVDTRFFSYCTEVSVNRVRDFSKEKVSQFLEERGNSIALVCEEGFLKLHIHTNQPREIIEYMKTVGTVEHVKIDNLNEQVSRYAAADPDADCAVLAFIPGEGYREIFASLGVHHCILYTSHLPSMGEILEYIEGIPEQNIIVLPNNRNILPAVIPAAESTAKHVSVIHTGTILQGLTTAYGYSANDCLADNVSNMQDCLDLATGIYLYCSIMESGFDGRTIHPGEYFALCDENLSATGRDLAEVALASIRSSGTCGAANITFFYQDEEVLEKIIGLEDTLAEEFDNPEIEYLFGGQHRETLIISLE